MGKPNFVLQEADSIDYSKGTLEEEADLLWKPSRTEQKDWALVPNERIIDRQYKLETNTEYHTLRHPDTLIPTGKTWVHVAALDRENTEYKKRVREEGFITAAGPIAIGGAEAEMVTTAGKAIAEYVGEKMPTAAMEQRPELDPGVIVGEGLAGGFQQRLVERSEGRTAVDPTPTVPMDHPLLKLLSLHGGNKGNTLAEKISEKGFQNLLPEEKEYMSEVLTLFKEQSRRLPVTEAGGYPQIEQDYEKYRERFNEDGSVKVPFAQGPFDPEYANRIHEAEYDSEIHGPKSFQLGEWIYTPKESALELAQKKPKQYEVYLQQKRHADQTRTRVALRDTISTPAKNIMIHFSSYGVIDEDQFLLDAKAAHRNHIMKHEYPGKTWMFLGKQHPDYPKSAETIDQELEILTEVLKRSERSAQLDLHRVYSVGRGLVFASSDWTGARKRLMEWHQKLKISDDLHPYFPTDEELRENIQSPIAEFAVTWAFAGARGGLDVGQTIIGLPIATMYPATVRFTPSSDPELNKSMDKLAASGIRNVRSYQKPHALQQWASMFPTSWIAGSMRVHGELGIKHTAKNILPKVSSEESGVLKWKEGGKIEFLSRSIIDAGKTLSGRIDDPDELRFLLDTMQTHEFLSDVVADLYGHAARSLDASDDDIVRARLFGALAGFGGEFTPVLGADPITGGIALAAKNINKAAKVYREYTDSERQLVNTLAALADKDISAATAFGRLEKSQESGRRLAPFLTQKAAVDGGFAPDVIRHMDHLDRSQQKIALTIAEGAKRRGIHNSPLNLPGRNLTDVDEVNAYLFDRMDWHRDKGGHLTVKAEELAKQDLEDIIVSIEKDLQTLTMDGDVYIKYTEEGEILRYVRNGDIWEQHSPKLVVSPIPPRQIFGARIESNTLRPLPEASATVPSDLAKAEVELRQAELAKRTYKLIKLEDDLDNFIQNEYKIAEEFKTLEKQLIEVKTIRDEITTKISTITSENSAVLDEFLEAQQALEKAKKNVLDMEADLLDQLYIVGAVRQGDPSVFRSMIDVDRQAILKQALKDFDKLRRTPLKGAHISVGAINKIEHYRQYIPQARKELVLRIGYKQKYPESGNVAERYELARSSEKVQKTIYEMNELGKLDSELLARKQTIEATLNGSSQTVLGKVHPAGRYVDVESGLTKDGKPVMRRMWVEEAGLANYMNKETTTWILHHRKQLEKEVAKANKSVKEAEKSLHKYRGEDPVTREVEELLELNRLHLQNIKEQARAKAWKPAFRKAAQDIELGRSAKNRLPKTEKGFKDILKTAIIYQQDKKWTSAPTPHRKMEKGDTIIDPEKFRDWLLAEYGWPTLSHIVRPYIEPGTGIVLGTMAGETGDLFLKVLIKGRDGITRMKLTADQMFELQQYLPDLIHKARKATDPDAEALAFVDMLDLARQDPDLSRALTPSGYIRDKITALSQSTDPVLAEIGKTTDEVLETVKAVHYLRDHFDDEFYWIARKSDKEVRKLPEHLRPKHRKDALYDYVDGEGSDIRGGHTRLHGFWKDAVSQMRNDPRLKTMYGELKDQEQRLSKLSDKVEKIDIKIKNAKTKIAELKDKEIKIREKLMEKGKDDFLQPQLKPTKRQQKIADLQKKINDLGGERYAALLGTSKKYPIEDTVDHIFLRGNPLVALSRIGIPQGKTPSGVQAMHFYMKAYQLIQENAFTYKAFVREMVEHIETVKRARPPGAKPTAARIEVKASFAFPAPYAGGGYEGIDPKTGWLFHESATIPVRELAMGAMAGSQAALQYRANRLFTRAVGGFFSPDEAHNVTAFIRNDFQNVVEPSLQPHLGLKMAPMGVKQEWVGEGKREFLATSTGKGVRETTVQDAPLTASDQITRVLVRQGIPYSQKYVRGTKATQTKLVNLIETGADDSGRAFHMPAQIASEIDSMMAPVTKELAEQFKNARSFEDVVAMGRKWEWQRLWRTSIVTGLLIPRPRYWYNNFIGDFSQIWYEQGMGQGAQTSFQLLTGIPSWSKHLWKIQTDIEKSIQKNVPGMLRNPTLGSVTNAMLNPAAQRVWRNPDGVTITAQGQVLPNYRITDSMIEQGVLDTQVQEDLLSHFQSFTGANVPQGVLKTMGNWRDDIAWFATYTQQRQRANLYMDLIQKGHTPQEAARLTKKALYDWKHALSEWELKYWFGTVMPFYRFYKLGMEQALTSVTEPFRRPTQGLRDAMMGTSKMKRIHQQYVFRDTVPILWDPGTGGDYKDKSQQMDEMAKYFPSGYVRPNPFMQARRTTELEQEHYKTTRGIAPTYLGYAMPRLTLLDTMAMWNALGVGLTGTFIKMGAAVNPELNRLLAPDWEERMFSPMLDTYYPTHRIAIEQVLKNFSSLDTGGSFISKDTRLNPYEERMLRLLKMDIRYNHNKAPVFPSLPTMLYRNTPFLGTEIPGLLNPLIYDNPEMLNAFKTNDAKDYLSGLKWFVGAYAGFSKPMPMSPVSFHPDDALSPDQKWEVGAIRGGERQVRQQIGAYNPGGSAPPSGTHQELQIFDDMKTEYLRNTFKSQEAARKAALMEELDKDIDGGKFDFSE